MQTSFPLRNSRGSSLERGISPLHYQSNHDHQSIPESGSIRLEQAFHQINQSHQKQDARSNSSVTRHITPLRYKSRSNERRHVSTSPVSSSLHLHNQQYPYHAPLHSGVSPRRDQSTMDQRYIPTSYAVQPPPQLSLNRSPIQENIMHPLSNMGTLPRQLASSYNSGSGVPVRTVQEPQTTLDRQQVAQIMHQIKDEQRTFLESEVRIAMMDLKNNLFEQQFGFERQICNLINRITGEIKSMKDSMSPQQQNEKQDMKSYIDEETQKVQKLVLDDIGALQKWTDTIIDGVETLKKNQEGKSQYLQDIIKELQGDLAAVRNQTEEVLIPVNISFKELEQRINNLPQPENDEIDKLTQQNINFKQNIQKLQDQIDSIHRQLVDKSDKTSTDANFMVLQSEVDNIKVKANFYNDKNTQSIEGLKDQIKLLESQFQQLDQTKKSNYTNDLLVVQSQIQALTDYIEQRLSDLQNEISHQNQKNSKQLEESIHLEQSHYDEFRQSIDQELKEIRNKAKAAKQLSIDVKSFAQKIEERLSKSFTTQMAQEQEQTAKTLQNVRDYLTTTISQVSKNQVTYQEVFTNRISNIEDAIQSLKSQSKIEVDEILNGLQQSHSTLRDELDSLKDRVLQLDTNFTNCDISVKDIAKTEQQCFRELQELLRISENTLKGFIQKEKQGLETFVLSSIQNFDGKIKELSEIQVKLIDSQTDIQDQMRKNMDNLSLMQTSVQTHQARQTDIEVKVNSMNEGLNDLIDQFEVSSGVIQTLDEKYVKTANEVIEVRNQMDQILEQLKQNGISQINFDINSNKLQEIEERIVALENSQDTSVLKSAVSELQNKQQISSKDLEENQLQVKTLKQEVQNFGNIIENQQNQLISLVEALDSKQTLENSGIQQIIQTLKANISEIQDFIHTLDERETTNYQSLQDDYQLLKQNYLSQFEKLTNNIENSRKFIESAFSDKFQELAQRDKEILLLLTQYQQNMDGQREKDLENNQKLMNQHVQVCQDELREQFDLQLKEQIKPLSSKIQEIEVRIENLYGQIEKEQSSFAELKPELDVLEERFEAQQKNLSEKIIGLTQNIFDLQAQNKENVALSNFVTKTDLERRINQLSSEFDSKLNAMENSISQVQQNVTSQNSRIQESIDYINEDIQVLRSANESVQASLTDFREQIKSKIVNIQETITTTCDKINQLENTLVKNHTFEEEVGRINELIKGLAQPLKEEPIRTVDVKVDQKLESSQGDRLIEEIYRREDAIEDMLRKLENKVDEEVDNKIIAAILAHLSETHMDLGQSLDTLKERIQTLETKTDQEVDYLKHSLRLSISNLTDILQPLSEQTQDLSQKCETHSKQQSELIKRVDLFEKSTNDSIGQQKLAQEGSQLEIDSIKLSMDQMQVKHAQNFDKQFEVNDQQKVKVAEMNELAHTQQKDIRELKEMFGSLDWEERLSEASRGFIEGMERVKNEMEAKYTQMKSVLDEVKTVKQRNEVKINDLEREIEQCKVEIEGLQGQIDNFEGKFGGEVRNLREKLALLGMDTIKLQPVQQEPTVNEEALLEKVEEKIVKLKAQLDQDFAQLVNQIEQDQQSKVRLEHLVNNESALRMKNSDDLEKFMKLFDSYQIDIQKIQENLELSLKNLSALVSQHTMQFSTIEPTVSTHTEQISNLSTLQNSFSGIMPEINKRIDDLGSTLKTDYSKKSETLSTEQILQILQDNLDAYLLKEDFASHFDSLVLRVEGLEGHSHPQTEEAMEGCKNEIESIKGFIEELREEMQGMHAECRLRGEEVREFQVNVFSDMEFMEAKLIEALQKDTIAQIQQDEIDPLKHRLSRLEGSSLSPSRAQVDISNQQETPSTTLKNMKMDYQRILEEMKQRRQFYLRKTPLDRRIEEIMRQNDCSQSEACRLFQKEIEKQRNSFMQMSGSQSISPLRNTTNRPNSRSLEKTGTNQNLVEKISPSRMEGLKRTATNEEANIDINDLDDDDERENGRVSAAAHYQYLQDNMRRISGISPMQKTLNVQQQNEVQPFKLSNQNEEYSMQQPRIIKPYSKQQEMQNAQEFMQDDQVAFSSSRNRRDRGNYQQPLVDRVDEPEVDNIFDRGSQIKEGSDALQRNNRKISKQGLITPQFDELNLQKPQQQRFNDKERI